MKNTNVKISSNCAKCGVALGCSCSGKKDPMYYNGVAYCISCYYTVVSSEKSTPSSGQNAGQAYQVKITSAQATITETKPK